MFGNLGWGEIFILVAAGLIILGPERLPGAVSWTLKSLRQVRDYATGATSHLKEELGPEFDDLRKPLADLNELRGMTPGGFVTKHLLDGDSTLLRPQTYLGNEPLPGATPAQPRPSFDKAPPAPPPPTVERHHDVTDWDAT